MANNLWNETFGFGIEEIQISNIEDHAVPIFNVWFMSYSKSNVEIGIEIRMIIYFLQFCWDKFMKN